MRKKMALDPAWIEFLEKSKPHIQNQKSDIYVPLFTDFQGGAPGIYQIVYSSVPIEALENCRYLHHRRYDVVGSKLICLAYQSEKYTSTEVSPARSSIEIWKFDSWAALDKQRSKYTHFEFGISSSRLMIPTSFSPSCITLPAAAASNQ
jgi:hypothetical protein